MRMIQATEAKIHLAELLRNVEQGETIAITRHGKPIAHLIPAEAQERLQRKRAVEEFFVVEMREKRSKRLYKRCLNGVTRGTAFERTCHRCIYCHGVVA